MKRTLLLMATALALVVSHAEADAKRRGGSRPSPSFDKPDFKTGGHRPRKPALASISCDNVLNDIREGETPRQALNRWKAENPGADRLRNCNFTSR